MTKDKTALRKVDLSAVKLGAKKEKPSRRRQDKRGDNLAELGILAAQLKIVEKNEADSSFMGKLPPASFAEFMKLWGRLHREYVRFGARWAQLSPTPAIQTGVATTDGGPP